MLYIYICMICKLAYLFYCVLVSYRIVPYPYGKSYAQLFLNRGHWYECAFNHGLVVALFMNLFYGPLLSILGRCIMIMGRLGYWFIGFLNSRLWSLMARILCFLN